MALSFERRHDAPLEEEPQMPLYRATERLYLTEERPGHPARVVKEGDPDAHMLFVGEGGYVPFQLAEKYGLLAGEEQPAAEPEAEATDGKARSAPPATKARSAPPETK